MNNSKVLTDGNIGIAKLPLKRAAAKFGELVEIGELVLKDGKPVGRATAHVKVMAPQPELSFELPKSFEYGNLHISKIKASNIKNTEYLNLFSNDPKKIDSMSDLILASLIF
jgi:hypothetical protein